MAGTINNTTSKMIRSPSGRGYIPNPNYVAPITNTTSTIPSATIPTTNIMSPDFNVFNPYTTPDYSNAPITQPTTETNPLSYTPVTPIDNTINNAITPVAPALNNIYETIGEVSPAVTNIMNSITPTTTTPTTTTPTAPETTTPVAETPAVTSQNNTNGMNPITTSSTQLPSIIPTQNAQTSYIPSATLNPYITAGTNALQSYQDLISGKSQIQNDPIYNQSLKEMNKQLSAQGYTGSGTANINKMTPLLGELYGRQLNAQQNLINTGLNATTASLNNDIAVAGLTGTYEGQQTLEAIAQEADMNYKNNLLTLENNRNNISEQEYNLKLTQYEDEKTQTDSQIKEAKATNMINMVNNGNIQYADLTTEDKDSLAEYYGIDPSKTYTSTAEMEATSNRLNMLWEGVNNGTIVGPAILQEIATAYDLDINELNIPDFREKTIDSYIANEIANDRTPDIGSLNEFIKTVNTGKQTTDPDYIQPYTNNEVVLSNSNMNRIFGATAKTNLDTKLRSLLKKTGLFSELNRSSKDIESTQANYEKFKNLYNTNQQVKDYIDSTYGSF